MKSCFILLGLLLTTVIFCPAQSKNKYASIDRYARSQGYPNTLKALAAKLTAPYQTEEDKVRSIFIWITAHITYDVTEYLHADAARYTPYERMVSTAPDAEGYQEEVLALAALKDHMAVCAGYAALFKVLCSEAGIRSVIIEGNGRTYEAIDRPWVSNHAWNAVYLRGQWTLLDVTWASGYVSGTKAVRKFDPYYYNTPPEEMIRNHYPDSLKWSLLPKPPSRKTYSESPYIFIDNGVIPLACTPQKGVVDVPAGDSAWFSFQLKEPCRQVDIYNDATRQWIHYRQEAPAGKATSSPVKVVKQTFTVEIGKDGPTPADIAAVDSIWAYLNSIPGNVEQTAPAPKTGSGKSAPTFHTKGDTIRFAYPVKQKGKQLIHICLNGRSSVAYIVNGR